MKKTFILNKGSHVEIDIVASENEQTLLTVSIDDGIPLADDSQLANSIDCYFEKTVELGLMDSEHNWEKHVTQAQIALWVDMYANIIGLENRWLWAQSKWGLKYLKQVRSRSINEKGIVIGEKQIFACFE